MSSAPLGFGEPASFQFFTNKSHKYLSAAGGLKFALPWARQAEGRAETRTLQSGTGKEDPITTLGNGKTFGMEDTFWELGELGPFSQKRQLMHYSVAYFITLLSFEKIEVIFLE